MTLYDIFMRTGYYQDFHVYDENKWGQHVHRGSGTRKEIVDEDICPTGIDVLCNEVLHIMTCKDGSLLIVVKATDYKKRTEKLYSKDYVARWDRLDPKTRPWRTMLEIEKECEVSS